MLGFRKALLWVILAGTALAGLGSQSVFAAPSLVLLEDNGDSNPVYRKTIESLGALIVANNLGHTYDHIDVLVGSLANREALFAQIRKRGAKSDVDVVILTHGADKRIALGSGDLTDNDIRAAGNLPRLRLVYMMACYSASLESAWRAVGAQVVVGHQDVNSMSGFFFPRFLKRWAEGATVVQATEEAYRFSEGTARTLSGFIKDKSNFLSGLGVLRSEPVVSGVDMDRMGHSYPDHSLSVAALPVPNATAASVRVYSHTDFERTGISLLGAMVPQASLNPDTIPSAQGLVDRVRTAAWDQLQDSFPVPSGGDFFPGVPIDLPTQDGEQIWIDGEAIRYLLDAVKDFAGDKLAPVIDHVQGVRLTRQGDALNVAMYFDQGFDIGIQDESNAPNWQPYSVHVPKTIRFSVRMTDGVLVLSGLDEGVDALNIKLKMPALPDSVWLRTASLNLSDGKAHIEAGVIGNLLTIVANANITARKFDGVDVWATIQRNLSFFEYPDFNFHLL